VRPRTEPSDIRVPGRLVRAIPRPGGHAGGCGRARSEESWLRLRLQTDLVRPARNGLGRSRFTHAWLHGWSRRSPERPLTWSRLGESNPGPTHYETRATALQAPPAPAAPPRAPIALSGHPDQHSGFHAGFHGTIGPSGPSLWEQADSTPSRGGVDQLGPRAADPLIDLVVEGKDRSLPVLAGRCGEVPAQVALAQGDQAVVHAAIGGTTSGGGYRVGGGPSGGAGAERNLPDSGTPRR
jgi:hypothetical protein